MRMSEAFPGTYLKCSDLQKREVKVTIERVQMEEVGSEHKPIVYFLGKERGLCLNKTNGMTLQEALGDETDDWYGKSIVLFPARTQFQGQMVDCIRVRVDPPPKTPRKPKKATPQQVEAEQFEAETGDDIPF